MKVATAKKADETPTLSPLTQREHNMRLLNAAITIADSCVRSEVECWSRHCLFEDGRIWLDTSAPVGMTDDPADVRRSAELLALALRYIGLREPDAFPWRFVRHPQRQELVRFEKRP